MTQRKLKNHQADALEGGVQARLWPRSRWTNICQKPPAPPEIPPKRPPEIVPERPPEIRPEKPPEEKPGHQPEIIPPQQPEIIPPERQTPPPAPESRSTLKL